MSHYDECYEGNESNEFITFIFSKCFENEIEGNDFITFNLIFIML